MPISSKTKKIAITLGSSILLAGGIFILSASPAQAEGWFGIPSLSEMLYMALGGIANLFFKIAAFFVQIAAALLEFVFSIEKFTDVAVVAAGWKVCRDLANIGFVLALLVMAFDSVLNLNKYPIKTILPRLVVAALLINFSLVFCGIIIDFSQIATHYFYEAAVGSNPEGLSGQLVGALNIQTVFEEPKGDWGEEIKETGNSMSIIIGILFGTAILLIAAFSLAAAAIYFIVRIVSLWLLMIFAPIAWISMIVPNAPEIGGYWNKWWGEFLKWSFFAPVYMFFVYLAVMIASIAPITSDSTTAAAQDALLKNNTVSGFLGNGVYVILQYIAIIMILIAGLKYAQKSGVAGAGAVMKAGSSATNWAKNKAKGAGKAPLSYAYDAAAAPAMAKAGNWLKESRFSTLKKLGYRAEGKAGQMQDKVNTERGEKLKGVSEEGQMYMAEHSMGPNRKAAIETLNKSGALTKDYADKAKREQARKLSMQAINNYRSSGREKEARELEESKPDAIADATQQHVALDRAIANGNWKKWNASSLEDDAGKKVVEALQQAALDKKITQPDFNDTFKSWGVRMKKVAEDQMKASFDKNDNFDITDKEQGGGAENVARREMFASATGKLETAFSDSSGGLRTSVAQPFVSKMSSPQIASIYSENDLQVVGANSTPAQLDSIVRNLNGYQKKQIKEGALATGNLALKTHVDSSPGWKNVS